ncbi:uncharacterized protein MELLADRAFT_113915 [Melampsora larici-populina 98AG31]|uniref:Uncharacterized protein n=1 Tax=Melampsora larici-populina (strain 98AG31 / pathotype 3-4-7) TaxID=747676 RepID=F4SBH1_MELLP|nr:uncharacterized protein MELLADRAFT_113915 [Melampsora larici-populina 98AG31]EGF97989.1 hypothetical protein MELLADRAFT_113915 [Melampsora larici-populina 98AG31]
MEAPSPTQSHSAPFIYTFKPLKEVADKLEMEPHNGQSPRNKRKSNEAQPKARISVRPQCMQAADGGLSNGCIAIGNKNCPFQYCVGCCRAYSDTTCSEHSIRSLAPALVQQPSQDPPKICNPGDGQFIMEHLSAKCLRPVGGLVLFESHKELGRLKCPFQYGIGHNPTCLGFVSDAPCMAPLPVGSIPTISPPCDQVVKAQHHSQQINVGSFSLCCDANLITRSSRVF